MARDRRPGPGPPPPPLDAARILPLLSLFSGGELSRLLSRFCDQHALLLRCCSHSPRRLRAELAHALAERVSRVSDAELSAATGAAPPLWETRLFWQKVLVLRWLGIDGEAAPARQFLRSERREACAAAGPVRSRSGRLVPAQQRSRHELGEPMEQNGTLPSVVVHMPPVHVVSSAVPAPTTVLLAPPDGRTACRSSPMLPPPPPPIPPPPTLPPPPPPPPLPPPAPPRRSSVTVHVPPSPESTPIDGSSVWFRPSAAAKPWPPKIARIESRATGGQIYSPLVANVSAGQQTSSPLVSNISARQQTSTPLVANVSAGQQTSSLVTNVSAGQQTSTPLVSNVSAGQQTSSLVTNVSAGQQTSTPLVSTFSAGQQTPSPLVTNVSAGQQTSTPLVSNVSAGQQTSSPLVANFSAEQQTSSLVANFSAEQQTSPLVASVSAGQQTSSPLVANVSAGQQTSTPFISHVSARQQTSSPMVANVSGGQQTSSPLVANVAAGQQTSSPLVANVSAGQQTSSQFVSSASAGQEAPSLSHRPAQPTEPAEQPAEPGCCRWTRWTTPDQRKSSTNRKSTPPKSKKTKKDKEADAKTKGGKCACGRKVGEPSQSEPIQEIAEVTQDTSSQIAENTRTSNQLLHIPDRTSSTHTSELTDPSWLLRPDRHCPGQESPQTTPSAVSASSEQTLTELHGRLQQALTFVGTSPGQHHQPNLADDPQRDRAPSERPDRRLDRGRSSVPGPLEEAATSGGNCREKLIDSWLHDRRIVSNSSRSAGQLASQPASQSASQPASRQASQPAYQALTVFSTEPGSDSPLISRNRDAEMFSEQEDESIQTSATDGATNETTESSMELEERSPSATLQKCREIAERAEWRYFELVRQQSARTERQEREEEAYSSIHLPPVSMSNSGSGMFGRGSDPGRPAAGGADGAGGGSGGTEADYAPPPSLPPLAERQRSEAVAEGIAARLLCPCCGRPADPGPTSVTAAAATPAQTSSAAQSATGQSQMKVQQSVTQSQQSDSQSQQFASQAQQSVSQVQQSATQPQQSTSQPQQSASLQQQQFDSRLSQIPSQLTTRPSQPTTDHSLWLSAAGSQPQPSASYLPSQPSGGQPWPYPPVAESDSQRSSRADLPPPIPSREPRHRGTESSPGFARSPSDLPPPISSREPRQRGTESSPAFIRSQHRILRFPDQTPEVGPAVPTQAAPSEPSVRGLPSLGPCNVLSDNYTAETETVAVERGANMEMTLVKSDSNTMSMKIEDTETETNTESFSTESGGGPPTHHDSGADGMLEVETAETPDQTELSTYVSAEDMLMVTGSPSSDTCQVKVCDKIAKI